MERIFALGSNGSGQLGIGHMDDVSLPVECIFDDDTDNQQNANDKVVGGRRGKVKRISCGGNHTLILFEDGAVYAAGLNDDLRCGVRRNTDLPQPDDPPIATCTNFAMSAVMSSVCPVSVMVAPSRIRWNDGGVSRRSASGNRLSVCPWSVVS